MFGKLSVWLSCTITIWICIRTYSHSTYRAVRIVKASKEKIGGTVSPSGALGRDSLTTLRTPYCDTVYNTGIATSIRTIHGFGWRASL